MIEANLHTTKPRVVVVDDDAAMGRVVAHAAGDLGATCEVVAAAREFAAAFWRDRPNVIVLDLDLGDSDGIEVLRFLSSERCRASILLYSGSDERVLAAARQVGLELGLRVIGTMTKPVRAATLKESLTQAMQQAEPLDTQRLRSAIVANELMLEFQPIVRSDGKVRSLEALVRWNHPAQGRIPPDQFIPVAESDEAAIDELTLWVVGRAAEAASELQQNGIDVPVAVNISGRNLDRLELVTEVLGALRSAGIAADRLTLEVTESVATKDSARWAEALTRLRIKGIELAIDDFGTGYSSLRALRQLPFSVLKIDRSFTADMLASRDSRAIVGAVIALAHSMDLQCIAEGVETEDTAAALRRSGIDGMQGFLFARPLALEKIPAWVASREMLRPKLSKTA